MQICREKKKNKDLTQLGTIHLDDALDYISLPLCVLNVGCIFYTFSQD